MTNVQVQYFVNRVSDFDIDLYYFNWLCFTRDEWQTWILNPVLLLSSLFSLTSSHRDFLHVGYLFRDVVGHVALFPMSDALYDSFYLNWDWDVFGHGMFLVKYRG